MDYLWWKGFTDKKRLRAFHLAILTSNFFSPRGDAAKHRVSLWTVNKLVDGS